jgi:hypothetical protein
MANIVYDNGIRNSVPNLKKRNYFKYSSINENIILKCILNKQILKCEIYFFLLQDYVLSPVYCLCQIGNETSGSVNANNFLCHGATVGCRRRILLHSACVPDVATP